MKFTKLLIATASLLFSTLALAVDINSADAEALAAEIKGVGLKRAEAIVEYRKENGQFKTVDDLEQVRGIGAKTVDANRDNLSVGG